MKKMFILSCSAMAMMAAQASEFQDYAKIIKVEPQYTRVNQPRQECHQEMTQERIPGAAAEKSYKGSIIGGLVGGVVGNRVGKGNGRVIATAAGAVAGAMIGDNVDNRDSAPAQPDQIVNREVQVCNNVNHYVDQVSGYKVVYSYNGKQDFFMTPVAPQEKKIPVSIQVTPRLSEY